MLRQIDRLKLRVPLALCFYFLKPRAVLRGMAKHLMSPTRCDSATLFNNLMSACGWLSKCQSKRIGTHLERNEKIFP